MWHVLKAEISYGKPYLLGGFGLAVGVSVILFVVLSLVGEQGPTPQAVVGLRTLFLVMAPVIVSFIVQAYRSEERRSRLLMMGSLTPRQLAGVTVLIPTLLLALGLFVAALATPLLSWDQGKVDFGNLTMALFVGNQIFAYAQMGLLAQEASAASRERRRRDATLAWAAFGLAAALMGVLYLVTTLGLLGSATWPVLIGGHTLVAFATMAPTIELHARRRNFTR